MAMQDTIHKIEAVIQRRQRFELIKSLCLAAVVLSAAVYLAFHFHILQ